MLAATLLALASAVLHAAWNFLAKTGEDRRMLLWGQFAFAGLGCAPLILIAGFPGGATGELVASVGIHLVYVEFLARAYDHGDFSVAYPTARGTGALLASLVGAAVLGDDLSMRGWIGVALVVLGLFGLSLAARPASRTGTGEEAVRAEIARRWQMDRGLLWAVFTGCTIGLYTVIDAAGARKAGAFSYGTTLFVGQGLALSLRTMALGRFESMVASLRSDWRRHVGAGAALTSAYLLVLAAMRSAPVGYVATLRESSVVMGALAGWLLLSEGRGVARVAASAVVAAGLVSMVAGGT